MKKRDNFMTHRIEARKALGRNYPARLSSAYSVLIDGESLLKQYGVDDHSLSNVAEGFRSLREAGELEF